MSDNGNGSRVKEWIPTGVLVIGISLFGLWWNAADPRARMEKIEEIQRENRKELIESIARVRSDVDKEYTSLREHTDLQNKVAGLMTKAEFDGWKKERDLFLNNFLDRCGKK